VGESLLKMFNYGISNLPGMKEGIYGTSISGKNISIIKNITNDKIEASLEVLKYFTSKEKQFKVFQNSSCVTPIDEFLYDEKLCENRPCDLFKNVQLIVEPKFIKDKPESDHYSKKYQQYIYEFLYDDKTTVDETLKKILDLTRIYYITLSTENSYVGFIYLIFFGVATTLMISSLIFIFLENFQPFFTFFSIDSWIITVMGSIILISVPFLSFGPVKSLKCHLRILFMSIGYTLNIIPSVHKLIELFPEENKVIEWVKTHKYLFFLITIIIDVLLCCVSIIKPYTNAFVYVEDGESFEQCKFNGEYSTIIIIIFKSIMILVMSFLIFVEWNVTTSLYDLKFISVILYIDILFVILVFIFQFIKSKNYEQYFLFETVNLCIISISNYLIIYGIKVIIGFVKKKNVKSQFINNINEKFINNESHVQSEEVDDNNYYSSINYEENDGKTKEGKAKESFMSRMIKYHYESYNNNSYSSCTDSFNNNNNNNNNDNNSTTNRSTLT